MKFLFFVVLLFATPALAQDMCIDQCLPVPCKKSTADDCSKPKYSCTRKPCSELYPQSMEGVAEAAAPQVQEQCNMGCKEVPCVRTANDDCSKPHYECLIAPCDKEGSAPPPSRGYGAIAFNPATSAWAYSGDEPSKVAAEKGALEFCRVPGCKIVASFYDKCFGIAIGKSGTAVGYAVSSDKAEVRRVALEMCNTNSKLGSWKSCYMKEERCYKGAQR